MAKPHQQFLSDEMKPKRIKEVEDAAEELHGVRTERIALNKKEEDSQATLISVMQKHKLDVYKFENLIVVIEPGKTKAKIKEAEAPKEDPDQEED